MNIQVDGYNISYKITGDNNDKTAVILQGWGTELGMYDTMAGSIADEYKVVQFDLPGFGASEEPKKAWSVEEYSDFFCKFMQALEIKETVLIGHSYGGRMIIRLATRHNLPFEISKIVLVDSAGIMPKRSTRQKIRIIRYKILKKILLNKIVHYLFEEVIDDWKNRQGSDDYRNASPIMRQCLVKAVNEDLTHLLPQIDKETLLVWGDLDRDTPIEDAKLMEKTIPKSGLAVIAGTGHYSFLEQPAIFAGIIRSFLNIEG
ncbi:MAG: alpha/beta hydrolase [Clostridiales bacterium]|nr:alpha/beta hydrolase [Clostridiales bacterium]